MKLMNRPVTVCCAFLALAVALGVIISGCSTAGRMSPQRPTDELEHGRAAPGPPQSRPLETSSGASADGIPRARRDSLAQTDVKQKEQRTIAESEEIWVIAKPEQEQEQPQQQQAGQQPAADAPAPVGVGGGAGAPATSPASRMAARGTDFAMTRPSTGLRKTIAQLGTRNDVETIAPPPIPGSGQLLARQGDAKLVPVPLKHTDVKASIAGYIATVGVTQQYHNPFSEKIEAVYVFPLPENAAVNEFLMTIGERRIRGIIHEREEAQRVYNEAKRQGYTASLLTQERPNIFTQSVANIEPGKQIDIDIKYFHTLSYSDGWFEFVFPMVVGPRFNPSESTDGIGAKAHGSAVASTGQRTEVSYLHPSERSGHDISLSVHVDAGVSIEQLDCNSHRIDVNQKSKTVADVKLASSDSIPNKDFVLRYKVAGDRVKSALLTHRDERGGFFTLMVIPPESLKALPRQPVEFVFTLDVSGSMTGVPIEQSKAAIRYCLTHMRPDDTFQIVRFAGAAESMSPRPIPATPQNIDAAMKYIEVMQAGGGTMMLEGIRESLNFPADESRLRFVSFLTDGYIGNETEILRELRKCRGDSRVFSFGVGSSPNRYLLDGLARLGRGACAYLGLKDDATKVMGDYFERISHPAMTDLSIDFGPINATDVYPQRLPDVFVGRPGIITGRFNGNVPGKGVVKINGKVAGEQRTIELPVDFSAAGTETPNRKALAAVWARAKIADCADLSIEEPNGDWPTQIKQVALEYGLMSAYTAFVAVDSSKRTAGDQGTTINVPVPMPEGVRYETTVQEKQPGPAQPQQRTTDELRPMSRSN